LERANIERSTIDLIIALSPRGVNNIGWMPLLVNSGVAISKTSFSTPIAQPETEVCPN